ncbi:hypothetical protein MN608_09274 [Microdochium nivale]|nr:hypothetical protein MN608_09274 [Microdochium nivale]
MQTAPEDEALDILFRLRASADPQTILESSRDSMSRQNQPSVVQPARAVSPPAPFSMLEFEMSMRHIMPYPLNPPTDTAAVNLRQLMSLGTAEESVPLFDSAYQHFHNPIP